MHPFPLFMVSLSGAMSSGLTCTQKITLNLSFEVETPEGRAGMRNASSSEGAEAHCSRPETLSILVAQHREC